MFKRHGRAEVAVFLNQPDYIVLFFDDEAVEHFIEAVGSAYEKKIGYSADFYVVEIGDGPSRLA